MSRYQFPEAIVSTDWLQANMDDPTLRIFDCTYYLHYEVGTGRPYRPESGEADYMQAHIPGSAFLDLQRDFSDGDAPTKFMRLDADATAAAFARHGLGTENRAILYTRNGVNWATRFWWMLRWIGFDNAAVLDGGMDKWMADGRPIRSGIETYDAAELTAEPRNGLWADKTDMQAGIGSDATCSLNALTQICTLARMLVMDARGVFPAVRTFQATRFWIRKRKRSAQQQKSPLHLLRQAPRPINVS